MADVEAFIKAPSQESLGTFSKEQLLLIAEHFSVSIVGDRRVKENIKDSIVSTLRETGVFATKEEGVLLKPLFQASALSFEQQREMLLLQQEHEKIKWEHDRVKYEHDRVQCEHDRVQCEHDREHDRMKYEHDREHDKMKYELGIEKEITVERMRQESEKAKIELEGHRLSILRDHFKRWLTALEIDSFDDLCELMILEQFKNILPDRIATYVTERKVTSAAEAAVAGDEFVLLHKSRFGGRSGALTVFEGSRKAVDVGSFGMDPRQLGLVKTDVDNMVNIDNCHYTVKIFTVNSQ